MHFCKIYLHVSFFFHSAFSQTSSKPRYMSRNLMRKYALTSYKFLDIRIIVGSISHVQIAIDNRGYRMVIQPQLMLCGKHSSRGVQISSN